MKRILRSLRLILLYAVAGLKALSSQLLPFGQNVLRGGTWIWLRHGKHWLDGTVEKVQAFFPKTRAISRMLDPRKISIGSYLTFRLRLCRSCTATLLRPLIQEDGSIPFLTFHSELKRLRESTGQKTMLSLLRGVCRCKRNPAKYGRWRARFDLLRTPALAIYFLAIMELLRRPLPPLGEFPPYPLGHLFDCNAEEQAEVSSARQELQNQLPVFEQQEEALLKIRAEHVKKFKLHQEEFEAQARRDIDDEKKRGVSRIKRAKQRLTRLKNETEELKKSLATRRFQGLDDFDAFLERHYPEEASMASDTLSRWLNRGPQHLDKHAVEQARLYFALYIQGVAA